MMNIQLDSVTFSLCQQLVGCQLSHLPSWYVPKALRQWQPYCMGERHAGIIDSVNGCPYLPNSSRSMMKLRPMKTDMVNKLFCSTIICCEEETSSCSITRVGDCATATLLVDCRTTIGEGTPGDSCAVLMDCCTAGDEGLMCTTEDFALLVDCNTVGDDEDTSKGSCEVLYCCIAAGEESICNPARDCAVLLADSCTEGTGDGFMFTPAGDCVKLLDCCRAGEGLWYTMCTPKDCETLTCRSVGEGTWHITPATSASFILSIAADGEVVNRAHSDITFSLPLQNTLARWISFLGREYKCDALWTATPPAVHEQERGIKSIRLILLRL